MTLEFVVNHPDAVWLFDVDGTLIGSIRGDQLRPRALELLQLLEASDATLVSWSAGGADYARRMLARLRIDSYFSAFYSKELRDSTGRYRLDHLAPEHLPGTMVDDYPQEVPDLGRVIGVPQFLGGNANDRGLDKAVHIARSLACGQPPIFENGAN